MRYLLGQPDLHANYYRLLAARFRLSLLLL
jgi:hypothetical protein